MTGRTPAGAALLAAALLGGEPLSAQSSGEPDDGPGAVPARRPAPAVPSDTGGSAGAALTARPTGGGARPPAWSPWVTRGAGLAMLLASDVGTRRAVQDLREVPGLLGGEGSLGDDVAEFGNGLGAWKTSLPWLAAGSLGLGAALDGMRGAGRGLSVLGGIAAGSMVSQALNRAVGRGRPVWGDGPLAFDPFSGHASFPSGHVSFAFSVAGGVDAATEGWLPAAAAYTVAGTTAFARLYDDKHWLSDVVVGAALAATVSRLATRRTMELLGVARDGGGAEEGRSRPPRARLLVAPSVLAVQLRF